MAYTRSFTLIGNFTDNITPALDKINLSLDGVKKNLESLSRVTQPLKNDFKDLATHSRDFQTSLKGQAGELTQITTALKQYRAEMGRLKNTQRKLKFPTIIGGGNGGDGGGGRGGGGASSGGGRGGGGGGYGGYTARDSTFVFGQILGNQLAGVLTGSIVQGFQIGVGLMMRPFEYLQSSIKERIADEQSDIKAAGGYFSIARRQEKPFLKSFQEAMEYTQENNKYMAQLAAALPGNTQQYIEVMKRISDSISRTVTNDPKAAIAFANQLRASGDRIGGAAAPITDMGAKGIRQAITEIGGEVTKKTVLAGLGGGGAAGGATGAYGLPGLSERLLTQDQVSMGQFRRYAAIFRDPLISEALERFIPKLNASKAGTIERLKILNQMYDEVLPPEMVRAFQRSTAGIMEAYNTAIFGPETGFLGLGRKMAGLGKKMDDYGRYLDAKGDVTDFKNAVDASLSIFDMLRDIFANFGIALQPIAEVLPMLFDPLQEIGRTLTDIRHLSGRILTSFESYRLGLIKTGENIEDEGKRIKFLSTVGIRATLAAINNAFRGLGIYGYGEQAMQTFKEFGKQIKSENFDPGAMLASFIDIFVNSDASKMLGVQIGKTVSSVLQQISKIIDELLGFAKASGLVEGLKEGFGEKGYAAFANIIRKVFMLLGNLLLEVFKAAPLEFSVLGGVSLLLPAFIGGLSTLIGVRVERFLDVGLSKVLSSVSERVARVIAISRFNAAQPFPGSRPPIGNFIGNSIGTISRVFQSIIPSLKNFWSTLTTAAKGLPPAVANIFKSIANVVRFGANWGKMFASLRTGFTSLRTFLSGVGPRFTGFFKGFLGKLSIFGAIVTTIINLLQGKNLAESLAAGAGPLLGAALGTALIPFLGPFGPMIGAAIGSWIGSLDAVTIPLTEIFNSLLGAGQGLFNIVGVIVGAIGDLFATLAELIGGIVGVKGQFDGLKIVLAPFTLALQALELGLKGFAVLLQQVRVWLTNWLGSSEEKKAAQAELDRLNLELKTAQGRINAYNLSMLSPEEMRKKRAEAWRELNTGKVNQARASELRTFVAEVDKYIAQKSSAPSPAPLAATPGRVIDSSITTPKPSEKYGDLKGLLDKYNIKDPEKGIPKLTDIDKNNGRSAKLDPLITSSQSTATNVQQMNVRSGQQVTQLSQMSTKTVSAVSITNKLLGSLRSAAVSISNKLTTINTSTVGIRNKLNDIDQLKASVDRVNSTLVSGALKVKLAVGGTTSRSGGGGVDQFTPLAGQYGLMMTSGYRPGDPGWHGVNKARDYAGSPSSMLKFAETMLGYGPFLKELIYSPLGVGIRNGSLVPISSFGAKVVADHYDHVHVAYAKGAGNPAFFSSASAADRWERAMAPREPIISSVRATASEVGGKSLQVNAPITIYQQPGQDPEELATIVVTRLGMAVHSLSNHI